MTNRRLRIICIGTAMILIAFASIQIRGQSQQTTSQKEKPVSLDEILRNLIFTSCIDHPFDELNKELTSAVGKRKVNFVLSDNVKKTIKAKGGSDELLKAIDEALSPSEEDRIKEMSRLDAIIRENCAGTIEQRRKAIKAGKEFLEKFSDDTDYKGFVEWLKQNLPKMEERLKSNETSDQ